MNRVVEQLKNITKEENIYVQEPMSKHTSFRIGGNADVYVLPGTKEELQAILNIDKNAIVIGNASNVLVTDKGIRGIVIGLKKLNHYEVNGESIIADCGVPIAKLSQVAAQNGLTGLEFACGIPGTLGGAIYMNAGAYGGEMKDVVLSSSYIDKNSCEIKTCNEHKFGYRSSIYSKEIDGTILSAKLNLKKGNIDEITSKMQENKKSRLDKQPVGIPSAGSVFKRQEGVIPAKLIDEAGLKGYKVGGAEVSTKHAGFIVNTGNATSTDVLNLIKHIQDVIYDKFGVKLETEIKILGEI